jgi:hypothetical protein
MEMLESQVVDGSVLCRLCRLASTFHSAAYGYRTRMRLGNTNVRPLGGGIGCLMMIAISVIVSIVLTVLLNLIL